MADEPLKRTIPHRCARAAHPRGARSRPLRHAVDLSLARHRRRQEPRLLHGRRGRQRPARPVRELRPRRARLQPPAPARRRAERRVRARRREPDLDAVRDDTPAGSTSRTRWRALRARRHGEDVLRRRRRRRRRGGDQGRVHRPRREATRARTDGRSIRSSCPRPSSRPSSTTRAPTPSWSPSSGAIPRPRARTALRDALASRSTRPTCRRFLGRWAPFPANRFPLDRACRRERTRRGGGRSRELERVLDAHAGRWRPILDRAHPERGRRSPRQPGVLPRRAAARARRRRGAHPRRGADRRRASPARCGRTQQFDLPEPPDLVTFGKKMQMGGFFAAPGLRDHAVRAHVPDPQRRPGARRAGRSRRSRRSGRRSCSTTCARRARTFSRASRSSPRAIRGS